MNELQEMAQEAKNNGMFYNVGYPDSSNFGAVFLGSYSNKEDAKKTATADREDFETINVCDPEGYVIAVYHPEDWEEPQFDAEDWEEPQFDECAGLFCD